MSNPSSTLLHDCEVNGCWHALHAIKYGVFADCFPRGINFSDLDAIVEINGSVLALEWKSNDHRLSTGQRLLYERLASKSHITTIIVIGNAETMEVTKFRALTPTSPNTYAYTPWIEGDLDALKSLITEWVGAIERREK